MSRETVQLDRDAQLELLISRYSTPAADLAEPAPDGEDLRSILQAAMSAPDHGGLRPWRFVIIRGEARQRLGDLLVQSLLQRSPEATEAEIYKQRSKPLRSPLIIAVAARIQRDHPKIPEQEQILSAGCAAEHIQLAARALGYGSVWLTGPASYDWSITEALGLSFDDRIIGFIYLGTPQGKPTPPVRPDPDEFTREWFG